LSATELNKEKQQLRYFGIGSMAC